MRQLILAAALLLPVPAASAQDGSFASHGAALPPPPDPVAITIPDLSHSGDPEVVANGWKYFLYRKNGTTFAQAYSDVAECFRFQQQTGWENVTLPRFVPWRRRTGTKTEFGPPMYGLVGVAIGAMVEGTLVRRDNQSKMRRCMEPRGYTRYGVSEAVWEKITSLPAEQAIAIEAKIASGPDFGGKVPTK